VSPNSVIGDSDSGNVAGQSPSARSIGRTSERLNTRLAEPDARQQYKGNCSRLKPAEFTDIAWLPWRRHLCIRCRLAEWPWRNADYDL